MWKMKCNENGQLLNTTKNTVHDPSFRPPIPRAISSWSTKNSSTFSTTTSSCYHLQNPNIPAWNIQPLNGLMSDYGVKKEINRMPLVSTRWNPTPDQLQALEEMYRRGIRTPSAQQIQQITAKLRKFGKIEGKNVFYWFQNHKAREKQKKRRQLELLAAKNMSPETRQSGLSKRYLEIQEPNRLPTSSNCNTPSKYSINDSVLIEECKKDMWTQLEQKELQQQQKKIITANSQICLFSCMSPNSSLDKGTSQKALGQENGDFGNVGNGIIGENKTLQLFPIKDNNLSNLEETKEFSCMGTRFKPNQFIEFLPMKSG